MFKRNKAFDLEEVLDGCLRQKASAQKQLFEQYYGFAKSIALRYAANPDEAQEMVNDGFLKVFSKIDMYDRDKIFESWFKTVIVRTCIDHYRKHMSKAGLVSIEDLHYLQYDDNLLERITAEEILDLIQQLPPSYRMVFSLFVVEGYSHAEIAKMMGINEGTSRSNLAKARMKMKEMVKVYMMDVKECNDV
ncbi:sigma-70 family RNA polymerase sigma factor [Marinilongibacter aquaticus]|uniref:RNA polymerase sigma factor n=1 Tax=Marinilongibacter aquaticus TaxID=2975157 RepID=UPI0021BD506A|nr:sigma-70 family RNA polymerase sigma factor [Marinilongibacter aquaticus]UBM57326.1 sigma-70 family RNA polymerase sigma factor [Marinilongibacter aquaticus]